MTNTQHAVILVYSANHALRAEKALQEIGITCKLIPVPRYLSSDCGVCIRILQADEEWTLRALEEAGVEIRGLYRI